jgi:hydroxyacylglutathione hydrolase
MVEIWPVPVLADNYVWVLQSAFSPEVVVVDPGAAEPVMSRLSNCGLTPGAILVTHHHTDHVGGVAGLLEGRRVPVHGPAAESIAFVDRPVRGGDRLELAPIGVAVDVLDVPGHTSGHVAYVGRGFVLCGDALFTGGCGRVFEGTPAQMVASLDRIAELPPQTSVYCAHEYTEANLRFACQVEPDNADLRSRLEEVASRRVRGLATVPSTLAEELRTNPFLRCGEPSVVAAAERHSGRSPGDRVDVFAIIRSWKDGWRA